MCKFYLPTEQSAEKETGVCARFPPVPAPLWGQHPLTKQPTLLGVAALRPEVSNEGTCGEWTADLTRKQTPASLPKSAGPKLVF